MKDNKQIEEIIQQMIGVLADLKYSYEMSLLSNKIDYTPMFDIMLDSNIEIEIIIDYLKNHPKYRAFSAEFKNILEDITPNKCYYLTNGEILDVEESNMEGMAGESMTVLFLRIGGDLVHFKDIENKLAPKDKEELSKWLNALEEANYNSAVSYVK